MQLINLTIDKFRLTVLAVLLLLVLGGISYTVIPRREDPLIAVPGATVMVHYPGSGARDIERFISRPLEEKINEIEAVDKITSTSSQGTAVILIEFDYDTDMAQNMQTLREKVREAEKELPEEALDPEIKRSKTETTSLVINLSGPFSYRDLYRFAKYIKRDLEKIKEIMTLEIEGDQKRQVHVEVDQGRLSQYIISLDELIHQIRAENISLPGGHMDISRRGYLIRTDEEFQGLLEIGETMVGSFADRPVFLKDIARIKDTYERPEFMVRFNGKPGVNLLITQKPKADLQAASGQIRDHLKRLSVKLPADLKVNVFSDQALSVSQRLKDFRQNLIMGAVIVVLVTLVMMDIRMALIIAFILPLSIGFALIMLYQFGHSLNQITLAAMVIVLGMLVDNGIVVVENIQRHLGLGKQRLRAALDGSREVMGAIIASTLTTVLAFTPLLFMAGDTGQFIRGIPLTIIFALSGSLMVAIFVSPLLSHRFLKSHPRKAKQENMIIRAYLWLLGKALNHKFIALSMALVAFIGSLAFIPRLGLQFFPKAEKNIFIIEAALPQGTNIDTTLKVSRRIEKILLSQKEISNIMCHVGGNGPRIYYNINPFRTREPNKAQFFVRVDDAVEKASTARVIKNLRPLLQGIAGARIELKELEQGPPVGAPIAIKIKGDDLDVLRRIAIQYRQVLESIPGAVDVIDDASETSPQISIRIDSAKARLLGITNAAIAQTLRTAVYGTTAVSFRQSDEEIDVVVSLTEKSRNDLETFNEIYLKSMGGFKTLFKQVAAIRLFSDIGSIHRERLTRTVTVRSDVQGKLAQEVVDAFRLKARSLPLPPGYLVEYEGETKERTESFVSLGWAMIAAFMLVYIVLVAQFNSYKQPFTIALSLPLGLVGAVIGLWVTGYPFGFMAFLGVVSLTGIVVNDAIVLIDFINVLRRGGEDLRTAVTEAVRLRFRPVMLTTISTVGGLLPLAIRGGSLWGPMGNVIIFGLSMATLLTLLIIPLMYELLEGRAD